MNGDPGPSTEGVEMQDRRAAAMRVAMRSMTVYPSAGSSKEAESHAPLAPPADFALRGAALSAGDNLLQPRPEAEPTLRLSHPDPSSPEPQLDPGSPRIASQEGWAGAVAALHDELAASRNEIQHSRQRLSTLELQLRSGPPSSTPQQGPYVAEVLEVAHIRTMSPRIPAVHESAYAHRRSVRTRRSMAQLSVCLSIAAAGFVVLAAACAQRPCSRWSLGGHSQAKAAAACTVALLSWFCLAALRFSAWALRHSSAVVLLFGVLCLASASVRASPVRLHIVRGYTCASHAHADMRHMLASALLSSRLVPLAGVLPLFDGGAAVGVNEVR